MQIMQRFEHLKRDFKAAENVSFRGTKIMEPEVSIFTIWFESVERRKIRLTEQKM